MGSNVLFLSLIVQHFRKLLIVMLIDLLVVFVIEMNISCCRHFLLLFWAIIFSLLFCLLHKEWLRDWIILVRRLLVGYYDGFLNCKRFLLLKWFSLRLLFLLLLLSFGRILIHLCLQYFLMDCSRKCFIILLLDITHRRSGFPIHCLVICVNRGRTWTDAMGWVPNQIRRSCCAIHT